MPQTAVQLERATPESVGISPKDILAFVDAVEAAELELHSLMLLRHGKVVAEGWWSPFRRDDIHLLYSLSKSFLSTAIGFAVQEGFIGLDDKVVSFFPDKVPANPSANLLAMRVRDLLSMSAGHAADDMSEMYGRADNDWVRGFLEREVPHEPGTFFLYNSSASYVLSAIISKVTGQTTLDYLRPRFLDKLGIDKATWETCPNRVSMGGWGMSVTTDAITRFGQFYLQGGVWNGERLLSQAWVDEATRFHVSNAQNDNPDWKQGYGFQFWRSRNNCYRGDGAFGQFCVVIPEKEMVVAITASVSDMQVVLNLVWQHILGPAQDTPRAESAGDNNALQSKLASLVLPGPKGESTSSTEAAISGKWFERTTSEGLIQARRYEFDATGCSFGVRMTSGERFIRAGRDSWIYGEMVFDGPDPIRIAATYRWTTPTELELKIRYTESPSGITVLNTFDGDTVKAQTTLTARFGPSEGPVFEGKLS